MIQSVYCRHWNPEVHDGSDRMYYIGFILVGVPEVSVSELHCSR